jgi:hypothetical protein
MDDRWCELQEQPFYSDKPLVGPLIVWFRTLWNNVATRWYVIPIMQQQTEINHRLRTETAILRTEISNLHAEVASLRKELCREQEIRLGIQTVLTTVREELSGEEEIRQVLDKEMVNTRRDQAAALYSLHTEVARLRTRLEEAEQQSA